MSNFSKEHSFKMALAALSTIAAISSIFEIYLGKEVKKEPLVYEKQLKSLTNIEDSINTLREFVKNQKENLKASQHAVKALEEEHQKLKPVVDADRKVVDALFQLQAEKQQKNIWLDRAFGFFIGIASSLTASLFWAYVKRKRA